MKIFYILIAFLNLSYGFKPSCLTCKYFVPNNNNIYESGLCNMFQDKIYNKDASFLVKNLATHCRENENQCGEPGYLHELKENNKAPNTLHYYYEEIKTICSKKVVKNEDLIKLEKLELEMVNAFQKMRRHNKNITYRDN